MQDCVRLWEWPTSEGLWLGLTTADAQVTINESSFRAASESSLSLGECSSSLGVLTFRRSPRFLPAQRSQSVCGGEIIKGWLCWRLGIRMLGKQIVGGLTSLRGGKSADRGGKGGPWVKQKEQMQGRRPDHAASVE